MNSILHLLLGEMQYVYLKRKAKTKSTSLIMFIHTRVYVLTLHVIIRNLQ